MSRSVANGNGNSNVGGRIQCRQAQKIFYDISRHEEVVGLQDMTLDINAGEFVAVIGPSGCGKTTFLNIVAGFEFQTAGEITIDGKAITGPGPDRGVVFQEYALFPWLSVLHNVRYGLIERGISKKAADLTATRWLKQVGLDEFSGKYPHELSGGMRQRVALIRVLANEPTILLMDEPFAALDALTRSVLQKELLALWERSHQTVVFVTHNVDEAIFLADRMVIMSHRPSVVKEIVRVDLERPRDVTSDAFNAYRRHATKSLEAEVSPTIN